ncbi:hypothetical protein ACRAWB_06270 [Leifsonia poae]|uniref:hypothetical protein n=1 Tax=Leifsonia poae TaxID=110933 RepID=UPI003D699122
MSERTIVGWEGSLEADVAMEWAVERAERTGDGILLVDIEDTDRPVPGAVVTPEMVADGTATRTGRRSGSPTSIRGSASTRT